MLIDTLLEMLKHLVVTTKPHQDLEINVISSI